MGVYLVKRMMLNILVLLLLVTLVFWLMRILPGDAVLAQLSEERALTPEQIDFIRAEMGLDRPIPMQFASWAGGVIQGDLGSSLVSERPVWEGLKRSIVPSIELGLLALVFSVMIGIPVGILSAVRRNSWSDYILRAVAILGLSLPNFWIGVMVIIFPALYWGYSPPVAYENLLTDPIANLQKVVPAAIILAFGSSAIVMRMMRSTMIEVLSFDYIRTAHAKGLRGSTVILKHALKNSIIPVITIIGAQVSALVGGSVVMETLFGIPGMGQMTFQALTERDYTTIQSLVLVFGIVLVTTNLLIDLSYGYLDPRIRYS